MTLNNETNLLKGPGNLHGNPSEERDDFKGGGDSGSLLRGKKGGNNTSQRRVYSPFKGKKNFREGEE